MLYYIFILKVEGGKSKMNEKLKVLWLVWGYLDFNFWWLKRMVELGELSPSEAGYLITLKNQ